ncbi:MAG: pyridoxal-phosphate dependent enzyme, partial [Candidatus Ranarchaeia archaeon]
LEGQRTLGYEIFDELDNVDRIVIPVGNAGNISAVWKSAVEYNLFGWLENPPKMCGIQSQGAAPLVTMFKEGLETLPRVKNPETVATAIRIGNPVSWLKAIRAVQESKGLMESVSDQEILDAQRLLAQTEGLFVEPASASSIAGLKRLLENGEIDADERVVCITTGHGLKDPQTAMSQVESRIHYANNNVDDVLAIIMNA